MITKYLFKVLCLCILFYSCTTIRTIDFFKLRENEIETYNGFFIKNPNDNNYRQIEQLFGSISKNDTVNDRSEIIFKTIQVDSFKAFYAIATKDTLRKNPSIGPRYFLFSAFIFYNDTTFIAPVYEKEDLTKLNFASFKYKIPPFITKKDSVLVLDGIKKMVLFNFHKTNLLVNNQKFSNCLEFEIRDIWPDTLYGEKVWLHKEYGLLKWIRSTGRVETRIL
jgi:hypothetical protein